MLLDHRTTEVRPQTPRPGFQYGAPVNASALAAGDEAEVLAFLSERPLENFIIAGLARDNGLLSPLNRGSFYACRNDRGALEGVALIGHAVLFDTRSDAATAAFARLLQGRGGSHMLLGQTEKVERFWDYYTDGAHAAPRFACRELLYELRGRAAARTPVRGLRLATLDDLDIIIPVHARMAFEESGVDPLTVDAEGFRRRCARRVEQGRVWVVTEGRKLIFKADAISESREVIYLEGVYVRPEERRKGYGLRCLSQLGGTFLKRAGSICVLINEQNGDALRLYRKAGFKQRGTFDSIFLRLD